jgi:hypothetical protein
MLEYWGLDLRRGSGKGEILRIGEALFRAFPYTFYITVRRDKTHLCMSDGCLTVRWDSEGRRLYLMSIMVFVSYLETYGV